MLDLARLKRIKLKKHPPMQILLAQLILRFDYSLPRNTRITLEGIDHIPRDRGVFFAMNHTDRYNYWPFQYQMYRQHLPRFTATWVKGKYYENRMMGAFMDSTNNIPLPSRGYVISTEFRKANGRAPTDDEYRAARARIDAGGDAAFEALFDEMMAEVTRLTRQALFEADLNVLVFPQGTRSKRLARGHTGLMQMAQHLGAAIVPVGCNGSDRAYPGGSPFSKGGDITYRIGPPLELDGPELGPHRVRAPFVPFTAGANAHADAFRAATDVMMAHIDRLLDDEYKFAHDQASDGVEAMKRFL